MKQKEEEYSKLEDLSVFIINWNVGGFEAPKNFDITQELLAIESQAPPDIVAFGLQDVFQSSLSLGSCEKLAEQWNQLMLTNLETWKKKYVLLKKVCSGSLALLIYTQDTLSRVVSKVADDVVSFGMLSKYCALTIKFNIDHTSMCFVSCQLEEGSKKLAERVQNLNEIHSKAFQKDKKVSSLSAIYLLLLE